MLAKSLPFGRPPPGGLLMAGTYLRCVLSYFVRVLQFFGVLYTQEGVCLLFVCGAADPRIVMKRSQAVVVRMYSTYVYTCTKYVNVVRIASLLPALELLIVL